MARAVCAGAPSGRPDHWHDIKWASCLGNVRRLQSRIVKATKEGRWGKVKALQWLLTHSFSGKAVAVRRVTENHGKKTPGVDGIIWSTPDDKRRAIDTLNRRGYAPQPLRRIYIPKRSGSQKLRPLGIPCMRDRAMQALHLIALEPVSETVADTKSYGFRRDRSTADAIEQCFKVLSKKNAPQWVLEGDIKACFDEISHSWLAAHVPTDKAVLQRWLDAGYLEKQQYFLTTAGTPQGGIISPALANWALDGLQCKLEETLGDRRYVEGQRISLKVNFVRYADDFVITGHSKEFLESEVKPLVEAFLRERGLTLSQEKTKITHISEGFDFLGQNIRKYKNGKLFIKPSKANVQHLLEKVRTVIKGNAAAKQVNLIRQLNPIITGWADYHRHIVAKDTYGKVDSHIWEALWKWGRRRHSRKCKTWIKAKYFHSIDAKAWIFAAYSEEKGPDGKHRLIRLAKASDTPIRRHVKIQDAANPFDPEWEGYFEDRQGLKMLHTLKGRGSLIRLWLDQDKSCGFCRQRITTDTGWDVHHIVRRVDGGPSTLSNLVMLHPNCHRQIHSRGLKVSKPAPFPKL
ncbi:group II intron reverse transcriptase/maturase [Cupriavidus sp. NPDC089707]|uniref:group II intron reverse transcriptase/maturase n=1 Tax=Cupriavidus sp. NPDC089707 TaxID=3363963 RepID=UPI00382C95EB